MGSPMSVCFANCLTLKLALPFPTLKSQNRFHSVILVQLGSTNDTRLLVKEENIPVESSPRRWSRRHEGGHNVTPTDISSGNIGNKPVTPSVLHSAQVA